MRASRAVRSLSAVGSIVAVAAALVLTPPSVARSAARPVCVGSHSPGRSARVLHADAGPAGRSSQRAARSVAAPAPPPPRRAIAIDVYVHVLRSKTGGGVSERRVERQIDVLNGAFAGDQSPLAAASPFRFRLADVDVTRNARWSRMDEGTVAERRAKRALHRGDGADLNLYIGRNRSGSLGWGTQPTRLRSAPAMDGVVIARHTLPGGSRGPYSAGDAAVHETGHWLGLLHTFAGGCTGRGDRVADTPREGRASYRCPVRRDTCTAPGDDPVHNFMDYSYDRCMNQFTAGQVARMRHAWSTLRVAAGRGFGSR
jgi:hypothetical protein